MSDLDHRERRALLVLALAGGASGPRRALMEAHGSATAVLDAGPAGWSTLGAHQRERLRVPDADDLARAAAWLETPGHHLLGWADPDYPPLLRRAPDPPLALFVDGDVAALWHPAVAVVGSRSPTSGGRDNAADFAGALAASGLCVASGLAAGIDTAAHEAALARGGRTIAVLGTGPDVAYPRSNAGLMGRIAAAPGGAVVSEHAPGTGPLKHHFPRRNRILAGLALGTLVVEAAERSGALITARLAAEAGREVFAVPGSIHNPLARGCHRLIRDGAALVGHADEVIAALAPMAGELAGALRERLGDPIQAPCAGSVAASAPRDPDYQRLWSALGHDPTPMDRLVERTGLTPAELSSMLLLMELDGRVAAEHGRYSRVR